MTAVFLPVRWAQQAHERSHHLFASCPDDPCATRPYTGRGTITGGTAGTTHRASELRPGSDRQHFHNNEVRAQSLPGTRARTSTGGYTA